MPRKRDSYSSDDTAVVYKEKKSRACCCSFAWLKKSHTVCSIVTVLFILYAIGFFALDIFKYIPHVHRNVTLANNITAVLSMGTAGYCIYVEATNNKTCVRSIGYTIADPDVSKQLNMKVFIKFSFLLNGLAVIGAILALGFISRSLCCCSKKQRRFHTPRHTNWWMRRSTIFWARLYCIIGGLGATCRVVYDFVFLFSSSSAGGKNDGGFAFSLTGVIIFIALVPSMGYLEDPTVEEEYHRRELEERKREEENRRKKGREEKKYAGGYGGYGGYGSEYEVYGNPNKR